MLAMPGCCQKEGGRPQRAHRDQMGAVPWRASSRHGRRSHPLTPHGAPLAKEGVPLLGPALCPPQPRPPVCHVVGADAPRHEEGGEAAAHHHPLVAEGKGAPPARGKAWSVAGRRTWLSTAQHTASVLATLEEAPGLLLPQAGLACRDSLHPVPRGGGRLRHGRVHGAVVAHGGGE